MWGGAGLRCIWVVACVVYGCVAAGGTVTLSRLAGAVAREPCHVCVYHIIQLVYTCNRRAVLCSSVQMAERVKCTNLVEDRNYGSKYIFVLFFASLCERQGTGKINL